MSLGTFISCITFVFKISLSGNGTKRAVSQHDMTKLSQTGDEDNLPLLRTIRKTLPYKNLRLTILKKKKPR